MLGKIWWIVRRAPRWLLRRVGIHTWRMSSGEKDLLEPIPEVHPPIDLQVAIASDSDLQRVREMLVAAFKEKSEFEEDADMGGICFVAKSNGQTTGFSWVTFQPIKLNRGTLARYPKDCGYLHGSFVFPEFRGKKIFQYLTREIYLYLKGHGYRYACNLTFVNNAASIAARRRMDARIDTLRFLKLPWLPLKVFGHRRFELERVRKHQSAANSPGN